LLEIKKEHEDKKEEEKLKIRYSKVKKKADDIFND